MKEEGGKEGRREGGKEGRREGGKEGGREGGREGRREGGREGAFRACSSNNLTNCRTPVKCNCVHVLLTQETVVTATTSTI